MEGTLFEVTCNKPGIPSPNRSFAIKLVRNYGVGGGFRRDNTQTLQIRSQARVEYETLALLPPHPNVLAFKSEFIDNIAPAFQSHLSAEELRVLTFADGQVRKGQYIVLDYHPTNAEEWLKTKRGTSEEPLPWDLGRQCLLDLFGGILHMKRHCVVHRDLKLSNILVSADDRLVICDFGMTLQLPESLDRPFVQLQEPGGNSQHLAPEVLNDWKRGRDKPKSGIVLDYSKQPEFAAGLVAIEILLGKYPLGKYPDGFPSAPKLKFKETQLPRAELLQAQYPAACVDAICGLCKSKAADRWSLQDALDIVRDAEP